MHWAWSSVSAMGPAVGGGVHDAVDEHSGAAHGRVLGGGGGRAVTASAPPGTVARRRPGSQAGGGPRRAGGRGGHRRRGLRTRAMRGLRLRGAVAGKDRPVRASPKPAADPTVVGIGRGRRRCSPLIPPSPAEGRRGRGRLRVGRQWGGRPASLVWSEGAFFSAPQPLPGGEEPCASGRGVALVLVRVAAGAGRPRSSGLRLGDGRAGPSRAAATELRAGPGRLRVPAAGPRASRLGPRPRGGRRLPPRRGLRPPRGYGGSRRSRGFAQAQPARSARVALVAKLEAEHLARDRGRPAREHCHRRPRPARPLVQAPALKRRGEPLRARVVHKVLAHPERGIERALAPLVVAPGALSRSPPARSPAPWARSTARRCRAARPARRPRRTRPGRPPRAGCPSRSTRSCFEPTWTSSRPFLLNHSRRAEATYTMHWAWSSVSAMGRPSEVG